MFTYISICLLIVNIEKNNDIEKHFKKYAQKWRLGSESVDVNKEHFLESFGTFV